jgi:hypothetical protein
MKRLVPGIVSDRPLGRMFRINILQ